MIRLAKSPKLYAALFAAVCIVVIGHYFFIPSIADSDWYVKIANGDIKDVVQPFSSRVLHPLTVHLISLVSGLPTDLSFWVLSIFLLFGFVLVLSLFFSELPSINAFAAFAVVFSPFLLNYFRFFYLSELFYSFLLVVFFYLLKKNNLVLSLMTLGLLLFARPTEALILGCVLAAVSFFKSEKKFAATALLVVIIASVAGSYVSSLGQSNIHNLGTLEFYVLKPAYNFFRFILGVNWLTNTMAQFCRPQLLLTVPTWLHLGDISWIGICGFDFIYPLSTLIYLFITFGTIPLTLFLVGRKHWRRIFAENKIWLLTALVYGALLFFLGSVVNGGLRTVGYGWPAFYLAALFIFDQRIRGLPPDVQAKLRRSFFIIQMVLLWLPFLLISSPLLSDALRYSLAAFVVLIVCFVFFKSKVYSAMQYPQLHE